MPEKAKEGYWWQCESCGAISDFPEACGFKGIPDYIWDVLIPSFWEQSKLLLECRKCNKRSMRITYEFPRREKVILQVIHIVGLGPIEGSYIPMMWETKPSEDNVNWFDFKYIDHRRNPWVLNKPAVFSRENLKQLFNLYNDKTDSITFP